MNTNTIPNTQAVFLRTRTGKPSGCVVENGILNRHARRSLHLLHKPPAWSFEAQILQRARELGAHTVRVVDTETQSIYTAPLAHFDRYGITIERGFGTQIALPLHRWHVENPAQLVLF